MSNGKGTGKFKKITVDPKTDKVSFLRVFIATLVTIFVGGILSWSVWVTSSSFSAVNMDSKICINTEDITENKNEIKKNVGILHGRINDESKIRDNQYKDCDDNLDKAVIRFQDKQEKIYEILINIQRDIRK